MKRKVYVLVLSLCATMALTACNERQSVSGVGEEAEISRDKSIYDSSEKTSDDSEAAMECWEYLSGSNGKQVDYYKAAEIIAPYKDSEDPDVLYTLGVMHDWIMGVDYNYELSYEELEKAETGGNYLASVYLGLLYEWGTPSIDRDYTISRDYFRRAILNGAVEGYYGLGTLYAYGRGMKKDVEQGVQYLNKVIDEGTEPFYIAMSEYAIGDLYYSGSLRDNTTEEDEPEYDKALEYWEKAYKDGLLMAAGDIGYMYIHGEGVDEDVDKGIEFYEASASAGSILSMRSLGWLYANGEKVENDSARSLEWFNKAAELNDPEALFALGQIYESGSIVDADPDKAKEYYDKAYAAGYED